MTSTKPYMNDPNVKIGGDRLKIFSDQAVLVPIIVSFWLKNTNFADWGNMKDITGLTVDYGDNPPERSQPTINGEKIILPLPEEMSSDIEKFEEQIEGRNKLFATLMGKEEREVRLLLEQKEKKVDAKKRNELDERIKGRQSELDRRLKGDRKDVR